MGLKDWPGMTRDAPKRTQGTNVTTLPNTWNMGASRHTAWRCRKICG